MLARAPGAPALREPPAGSVSGPESELASELAWGPTPDPASGRSSDLSRHALEDLHPALWRASQLGRSRAAVFASGFAELDAVLPSGGWPARALTELLLPHPGLGELRLLAPVLAALQAQERNVLWFDPPGQPSAWALEALGIRTRWLVLVRSRVQLESAPRAGPVRPAPYGGSSRSAKPDQLESRAREHLPAADLLWALEQALASGQAGAVLAWLPARLRADALRRLQLAAQAHEGPAFLLREAEARLRPSVAPLRLVLASAGPQCPDRLRVQLLKRRGPPLAQPLDLALPPVLAPSALARLRRSVAAPGAGRMVLPIGPGRHLDDFGVTLPAAGAAQEDPR